MQPIYIFGVEGDLGERNIRGFGWLDAGCRDAMHRVSTNGVGTRADTWTRGVRRDASRLYQWGRNAGGYLDAGC
jgi:hypothetical protein